MKVSTYKKILKELGTDIPDTADITIKEEHGSQYNESYTTINIVATWRVGTATRSATWSFSE